MTRKRLTAKTDQKARLFDLYSSVSELVRSGKRDAKEVADVLQVIKNKPDFLKQFAMEGMPAQGLLTECRLAEWQSFYQRALGITVDPSSVKVPKTQKGFDRVIYIPQGLTLNPAYQACKKRFKCWSYYGDDLDKEVTENDRISEKSYAIRIRDRQEADEELKNLSADQLKGKNIKGTTLLEQFVWVLKYHDETGEHLDEKNITLCSGSRYSDGRVPDIRWRDGRLRVRWCSPARVRSYLRPRAVVS